MPNKKQVAIKDVGATIELPTYSSPNRKFSEDQLRFILIELGKNTPPGYIIAGFKKEFKDDVELTNNNIEHYKRSKRWMPSIELIRNEYSRSIGNEYFALKRNRLRELQKLYMRSKNDKFRLSILKEVRLETEGAADGTGISIQGGGMNIQLVNYTDKDNPRKVEGTGSVEKIIDVTDVSHAGGDGLLLEDVPEDQMNGVGSNYKFAGINDDGSEQWDARDKNKKIRKIKMSKNEYVESEHTT